MNAKQNKAPAKPTKKEQATVSDVVAQVINAMSERLKSGAQDPMLDVHPDAPFLRSSEPWAMLMRDYVFRQMAENKGAGQRFDRAMKEKNPPKMAESLFLFMHFSFNPDENTVPVDPNEMTGFIRFTDEATSAILSVWTETELDANFVRALRRKLGIGKIPKRFLISKVVGTNGIPLSGK